MSLQTTARLSWKIAAISLLVAFFLTSNSSCSDGRLTNIPETFLTEKPVRPETTIAQGKLRGINMETHRKRKIFGFLGVPYAQPPIGDLRFVVKELIHQAPVPPEPWNGTLDASRNAEMCIQINDDRKRVGKEDCLYLNVFTPQLSTTKNSTLAPVMVYVFGGRFQAGNNTAEVMNPGFLLDEDVVLVVPCFRVGVLGFLSTGDAASPGNYGLKDVVQTLRWIQDNIRYFGGDSNQVTLWGASSGAMSVHILALSELTDGLFHKYIFHSGSAFCNSVNQPKEVFAERAIELGKHFGCPTNASSLLVDCLKGLDASMIVDANSIFYLWGPYVANTWLPTSEPKMEGALITDSPANLYAAGKVRDLPSIGLVTRDEGLIYALPFYDNPDLFEEFLKNIDSILPSLLEYKSLVDDIPAYTEAIKSYYLNDLTANRSQLLLNFTKLVGDSKFVYPAYKAVKSRLAFATSREYFGSFEYRGNLSIVFFYIAVHRYSGIPHSDDMIYLFGYNEYRFALPGVRYGEADWIMVDTMVQLWTSFAKNGVPRTADSLSNTIWEPYSSLNNYLRFGNGHDAALEMNYDLYSERMKFWDQLTGDTSSSSKFPKSMSVLAIALSICLPSCIF